MTIKVFNYLPKEAKEIRATVFVKEQGFKKEFDEVDNLARHMIIYEEEQPISTCRFYFNEGKQSFIIGRIAVIKEYRSKGIGRKMLKEAEDIIRQDGGKSTMVSGQVRVEKFYEKLGYQKQGEVFLDEGCPHIWMKKVL